MSTLNGSRTQRACLDQAADAHRCPQGSATAVLDGSFVARLSVPAAVGPANDPSSGQKPRTSTRGPTRNDDLPGEDGVLRCRGGDDALRGDADAGQLQPVREL